MIFEQIYRQILRASKLNKFLGAYSLLHPSHVLLAEQGKDVEDYMPLEIYSIWKYEPSY